MRATDEKSSGLVTAGLLAVVVALIGLAGAMKIAQLAVAFGPNVGDIVQFDPGGYMPVDAQTEIVAARGDSDGCTLNVATLHANGGSLVVEQRFRVDGSARYAVHWAGKRTADGAGNCGREADLTLDDANLDMLAMAAGGWGIHHRHVEASDLWTGNRPGPVAMR